MNRTEELRTFLRSSFPIETLEVDTGEKRYAITTAQNIEELIDRITEEQFRVDERLPYWAEIWHSAVALARLLEQQPRLVRGKDVLEIGCGLGLSGLAAAGQDANVTFSDHDEYAVAAAELNFLSNYPDRKADFRIADFRERLDRRWPVIIAADVIYERRFVSPLTAFIASTLKENGLLLLAEPNRMIAIPFFEQLTGLGMNYSRRSEAVSLHGRTVEISIYAITRSKDVLRHFDQL